MKHFDVIFGTIGTAATFGLSTVNLFLGFIAGVLTVGILAIRFRREWNNRNKPPDNEL